MTVAVEKAIDCKLNASQSLAQCHRIIQNMSPSGLCEPILFAIISDFCYNNLNKKKLI